MRIRNAAFLSSDMATVSEFLSVWRAPHDRAGTTTATVVCNPDTIQPVRLT